MQIVIDRLQQKPWFKQLTEHEQDAAIQSMARDPSALEQVEALLDRMDTDDNWAALTPRQEREQILGAIHMERALRRQREALEELDWYEELGDREQDAVRQTVELTTRIERALPRTEGHNNERERQHASPWHNVLRANRN